MSETKKEEEKKSKKSKWLILLLLLIIFALIGYIIFLMNKNKDEELPDEPIQKNVIVNEDDFNDIDSFINQPKTPAGSYTVKMNSTWNFSDGHSASEDAYLENERSNTAPVYFDLIREDTKELLLSSPIIPVGSHMSKITLEKELPEGSYECVCVYHLLDDNNNTISTVSMGVTVNILG